MYTLSATQVAWLLALPMVLMVMATGCLFALLRVTRRTAQEEPSESAQRPEHRLAPGLRKPVSLSAANGVTTLEAVLQRIPFFNDLSEAHLREVIRAGRSLSMEANESVFCVDDPGDAFYVILNGDVKIYRTDSQGHEIQLETLSAGDFFGELALIDGEPRPVGAATVSSCQLFLISRRGFLTLVSKAPRVLTSLLIGLSTRIGLGFLRRFELALEKEKMQVQMETMETERHLSIAHMVTGVAHELNTPLGIVNHAASMLIDALSPEAIPALAEDEHVQEVLSDIREASMLILNNLARADGLLQTFKCLSVKQMAERKEDVDIGTLTEESVDVYKMLTQESQLHLEVIDELGDLNRRWEGYPGHFSQILLNLLTNIERYAYPQDRGGKVQIMVSRDDSESIEPRFSVVVQDFGCGIPETELPKVFDAFYTTGRSQGGTGLGLAIVHNLVTSSLQGTIHIESAPGEGTRVLISLPHIVTGKPAGVESDKIPTDLVIKL